MTFDPKTALADCDTLLLDMDGTILDLAYDNYMWMRHVPGRWAEQNGMTLEEASMEWAISCLWMHTWMPAWIQPDTREAKAGRLTSVTEVCAGGIPLVREGRRSEVGKNRLLRSLKSRRSEV